MGLSIFLFKKYISYQVFPIQLWLSWYKTIIAFLFYFLGLVYQNPV